jgi:hypothetical protein
MAGPSPSTMTSIATSAYYTNSRTCSAEPWLGGSKIMSLNNAGSTLNSDCNFRSVLSLKPCLMLSEPPARAEPPHHAGARAPWTRVSRMPTSRMPAPMNISAP